MPTEVRIVLPTLHEAQREVERSSARYKVLACGRRWGKSKYFIRQMAQTALDGKLYGYFAPDYKKQMDVFREASNRLSPAASRIRGDEKTIELVTGGRIEFWTMGDRDAGRSRRYHRVGIDEMGLVPDSWQIWTEAVRPTLADFEGSAEFGGTPKGRNGFYVAYSLGLDAGQPDWASFSFPTSSNPYIPETEIEAMRREMSDRSFRQEVLAEFLDDAGGVFSGVREAVRHAPEKPVPPFSVGVDLARTVDFCVASVLDGEGRQCQIERWNKASWEVSIARIVRIAESYPGSTIWVDSTGVGDPVYERLRSAYGRVQGYKFTSDSKRELIENLVLRLERGEVAILPHETQIAELQAYEYQLGKSGHVSMNAPEGLHDDCVIALALSAWPHRERRAAELNLL